MGAIQGHDEADEAISEKRKGPAWIQRHVMSSVEEFLDLYNRLDYLLRIRLKMEERNESSIVRFINSLRRSQNYQEVDLADDLDSIRQLRNTLVHTQKVNGEELVDVKANLIETLKKTIDFVENPPLAIDKVIPVSSLFTCKDDDYAIVVLKTMMERGYSHVPLLDDNLKVVGVFSENVISAYLLSRQRIDLSQSAKIKEFSSFLGVSSHKNERYAFLSKDTSLEEALKCFQNSKAETGKRLGMIFFTENGKENEPVIAGSVASTLIA
jgi:predicted transcriptional regulator